MALSTRRPTLPRRRRRGARGLRTELGRFWSVQQLALVLLSAAGVALFIVGLQGVSGWTTDPAVWLLAVVPVLLVRVADSAWPLAYWAVLLYLWVLAVPAASFSWWSVLGGAGLILSHTATALSASAPPAADFPATVLRAWLARTVLALAAAGAVAGTIHLVAGRVSTLSPVAYVVGLLGVAALLALTRSNPPDTAD